MDESSNSKGEPQVATFADKFRYLIENVHPRDRGPFTLTEISDGIRRKGGTATAGYLSMLLNGARENPSLQVVQQIARFFHVPLDYFADDENYADFQRYITWVRSLREEDVPTAARTYNPYETGEEVVYYER